MRRKGRPSVSDDVWDGRTGTDLRGDAHAQLVMMYLMVNRHMDPIGIYKLPLLYVAHELGHPVEAVRAGMARCIEVGYCEYDEATQYVWVRRMAHYQYGQLKPNDNQVKAVRAAVLDLIETPYYSAFVERYRDAFHLYDLPGAPSEPLRSPFGAPSEGLRGPSGGPLEPSEAPPEPVQCSAVHSSPLQSRAVQDTHTTRARAREDATPDDPPTRPRLLPSMAPDVPPAESHIDPEPLMDLRSASDMLSRGPGESMAAREAHRLYGEVYVPACREAGKTPPKWSRAQIVTPFVRLVLFAHREAPDDPDAARRMLAHAVTERWRTWNGADKLLEPGAILADGKLDSLLAASREAVIVSPRRAPAGPRHVHTWDPVARETVTCCRDEAGRLRVRHTDEIVEVIGQLDDERRTPVIRRTTA